MALADLRREYNLTGLRRADLEADPIAQFKKWFEQASGARASGRVRKFCIQLYKRLLLASGAEPLDLTAMTLATVDQQGRPSARVVLLKGVDQRGLCSSLTTKAARGRSWRKTHRRRWSSTGQTRRRQVCIAGEVSKLPPAESDVYYWSRPRGSRLAAWASEQSSAIKDRAALEEKWKQKEAQFVGKDIPRPPFWGGYLLAPTRIEFWQGCSQPVARSVSLYATAE